MDENRLYESHEPHEEGFSLCTRVRESLPDLVEGYLDAMTAEAIRAHLSVCYLCAKVYDEMERTIKMVESLPFVDPRKDYSPAIMTAIREQQSETGQFFKRPWWRWKPKRE
jgi:predicted anti-sigma-YlaC factor YlaD